MDNRRRHRRIPVSGPARLTNEQGALVGRVTDVSPHGICIATAPTALVRDGKCFRVEMIVAGIERMFAAEVRYVTGHRIGLETREDLSLG